MPTPNAGKGKEISVTGLAFTSEQETVSFLNDWYAPVRTSYCVTKEKVELGVRGTDV